MLEKGDNPHLLPLKLRVAEFARILGVAQVARRPLAPEFWRIRLPSSEAGNFEVCRGWCFAQIPCRATAAGRLPVKIADFVAYGEARWPGGITGTPIIRRRLLRDDRRRHQDTYQGLPSADAIKENVGQRKAADEPLDRNCSRSAFRVLCPPCLWNVGRTSKGNADWNGRFSAR
jgi:hypothetical protein